MHITFLLTLLVACEPTHAGSKAACDSSATDLVDGIDQNCDNVDGTDNDGDGAASIASGGTDCDDANSDVYPNAIELCDALDNDCDGLVDEDDTTYTGGETYVDGDGDGYYDPDPSGCVGQAASEFDGEDCDDTREGVYPGVPETCGDGVQNDCDASLGGTWTACADYEQELGASTNRIDGLADVDFNFGFSVAALPRWATEVGVLVGAVESTRGATQGGAAVAYVNGYGHTTLGEIGAEDDWWTMIDDNEASCLGTSVAYVHDLFNESLHHAVIGADCRSSVFVGLGADGDDDVFDVDDLEDEPSTLELTVSSADTRFGFTLASGDDLNQDDVGDLIIGAPGTPDAAAAGEVWLLWGASSLYAEGTLNIETVAARVAPPADSLGNFGTAVAGLGDMDGDGLSDLGIAARSCDDDLAAVYLWSGADLADYTAGDEILSSTASSEISCDSTSETGAHAIAKAGDVDEDGFADLLIGGRSGRVYLVEGAPDLTSQDLSEAAATLVRGGCTTCTAEVNDASYKYAKTSVAGDADLNGDDHIDLAIGDPANDGGSADTQLAGAVYLVFGPEIQGNTDLDDSDAPVYRGSIACDWAGYSVTMADLDLDGIDDLITGVPTCNDANKRVGFVSILLGVEL